MEDEHQSATTGCMRQCRVCLDEEGLELLSPCRCTGSLQFVHRQCLTTWRISAYHRTGQRRKLTHCDMCLTPFAEVLHVEPTWPRVPTGRRHHEQDLRRRGEENCRVCWSVLVGTIAVFITACYVFWPHSLYMLWSRPPSTLADLSPAQIQSLRDIFRMYDVDQNNMVDVNEFVSLARDTGDTASIGRITGIVARKSRHLLGDSSDNFAHDRLNFDGFVSLYLDFGVKVIDADARRVLQARRPL
jgi:hypothetical protein